MGCLKEKIKEYVDLRKKDLKEKFSSLKEDASLGILSVNQDIAGQSYVKSKMDLARELGVITKVVSYDSTGFFGIRNDLEKLSKECSGVILQLPCLDSDQDAQLLKAIPENKDVDRLTPEAKGRLITNSWSEGPATAEGIFDFLTYLEDYSWNKSDKVAVVIGRGQLVGDPIARILRDRENMTIIHCHSKTSRENLNKFLAMADVVVVAANTYLGEAKEFTFKPNSYIFDCGLFGEKGNRYGCISNYPDNVNWTPPIGGVGKLTTISLFATLYRLMIL